MSKPDTYVVTGEVRLSYVHLLEKYTSIDGQEPKYSCVILVPKSDKVTIAKIKKAQQAALEKGKSSKFGGTIPRAWKDTFRDGDDDDSVDHERNPEFAGHMFMTISSQQQPNIVDRARNEILDGREIYSGMFARVSMNAFPFAAQGNKGVSFGLNNVQKTRDGDVLGGVSPKAEDDFDDLDDDEDVL